MTRAIRVASSALFAVLAVVCIGYWARSENRHDVLFAGSIYASSHQGVVACMLIEPLSDCFRIRSWSARSNINSSLEYPPVEMEDLPGRPSKLGFYYLTGSNFVILRAPHWALFLAAIVATSIPWLAFRYSLFALFSLTTVACILLGIVARIGP